MSGESDSQAIKRTKTYIKGLDENMQGGVPENYVVLVHGAAGTMKSSLCFNILYNEALLNKKNGLYLSLEQSYSSITENMKNMGYDLSKINIVHIDDLANFNSEIKKIKSDAGNLVVVDVAAIRKLVKGDKVSENRSWLNVVKNVMLKTKKAADLDLLTFDSLSALYTLSTFQNPRTELFYLFEFIRDLEVTSFLISEEYQNDLLGIYDAEAFLCDGIIVVRLTPFRRNVVREIKVDKMRATKCNHDVYSLEYKDGAFHAMYGGQNPLL